MASREELKEQKEKTSQALIHSALELCAEEGYASLSLRSVARKAGIAPTSFYRHFREIDELGEAMVDQAKVLLDECIDTARNKMTFPALKPNASTAQMLKSIECVSRPFAEIFFECFEENNRLLHLFFQEQTGSSKVMRGAIAEAMGQLIEILADTLKRLAKGSGFKLGDSELIAETMLIIVGHSGLEMSASLKSVSGDIAGRAVQKLNLLLLGALTKEKSV